MRNLAIYEDKLFVTTSDARMLALDARTGALEWETRIADTAEGLQRQRPDPSSSRASCCRG